MTETDKVFAGSIPALYDRHLGPMLFEPYALDLVRRLDRFEGRLLEIAAGTGIVTRALARTFPNASIVATDLNPPMLDFAARGLQAPNVTFRQADALSLPFEDKSFDAVVCQFGVMFFPDKRSGYAEAHRVLRPGGVFLFSVWDRLEENEAPAIVSNTVAACFPDNPPGFLARTPYGYYDAERIQGELAAAGFQEVSAETVTLAGRAASPADPAIGLCKGSPLRNEIETRDPSRLDEVTERATQAVAQRFGPGPIESKLQALVFAAIA